MSFTGLLSDVLSVNQHQTALAFAFDPLRNAIVECDHLKVFMENFDDPAPLSRVWCLDELRVALLLGKRVEICMPAQARDSFRESAARDPAAAIETIKRVCERVDIRHACATREHDRVNVLKQVEETLTFDFLNEVCREIIRDALLSAGQLPADDPERSKRWAGIFQPMLLTADAPETPVPKQIEIKRAVAMMQRWTFPPGSPEYQAGRELLAKVQQLARRFYGEKSQLLSDIVRQDSNRDLLSLSSTPRTKC